MPILHINLLGDFRLRYNDTLVTTIVQARMQALLAYLLIHRDAPQSRQKLAFLFWPDTSESQGRTNLRQLLHYLHHALPDADQFLQIETKTVQWRQESPFALDLADFDHGLIEAANAVKEGRVASERTALEAAVKHYSGDLLPSCYDDWIDSERERLRQCYVRALERLLLLEEEQRDYPSAIEYAQRLLRHDPVHETTYRRLMRLHALHGDRASALRVYHTCVTILERELGVEPNQNTQEAYQRLLNMEAPAVLGTRSSSMSITRSTLVGRHDEWRILLNAWKRAATGHTTFVLISGEAGLGKTRLAEEFLEWAGQQGITKARTRSYASEGQLAYAPATELLRTDPLRTRLSRLDDIWLTELARLLPELLVEHSNLPKPEPITENWQRKLLFESLAKAIFSGKEPLLLLLDDLQWCDQDTLEWLHYLLHFDAAAKLVIVGTVRPEEIDQAHALTSLVLDLRVREQLTEIELRPLDAGDTATLAEQTAGKKLEAEQISRLYTDTEGNPFFVVETIRAEGSGGQAVWRSEAIERDSSNLLPNPGAPQRAMLPPRIDAVIQARLRQLSSPAHELARVAATIGRAFTSDVLAQASDIEEETLVRSLDELWRRGIIREQGRNAYDFSHDYIRERAYSEISTAWQQVLHRRVASALEQVYAENLDTVSGRIAVHYEQAGGTKQAILYYQRAARVAQETFSNEEVCRLLRRALVLLALMAENLERIQTELTVLVTLGTALMSSRGYGNPEAEQTFLRAWELCEALDSPPQSIPVLAGLSVCYLMRGNLAQLAICANLMERTVNTESSTQFHSLIQFVLAGNALFRGGFLAARQHAELGFSSVDPKHFSAPSILFGYEPRIANGSYLALSLWLLGYPDQARSQMQKVLTLASQASQHPTLGFTLGMATVLHNWCGNIALTLEHATATLEFATEKDMPQWIAHGMMLQGWALAHQGRADQGIGQLQLALAGWQAAGAGLVLTYYLLLLADAHAVSGQLEEALQAIEEALTIIREGGESWSEAELYRQKGGLLLARRADDQEIEACFQRSLEIARLQQARSFELRAAISMGRLWQRQGKHTAARELLTEVYNSFSEGFDTADVRAAKEFLDSFV